LVFIVNLGLVVAETDAHAKEEAAPGSTHQAIFGLLMFYIIELILRFFVYRFDFFKSWLNTFDFLVVAVDILVEVLHEAMHHKGEETNLSILRIIRLVKALRVLRMFLAFRELFLMLHGLLSALKAILWASFLISILLTIWSIVVVEYIHPLNLKLAEDGTYNEVLCPRCRHAFESVIMSNLTFLQNIIVGTEETPVTVPLMEHHPWTALVFVPLTLILQLALLNLVVAVVCNAAQQSHLQDEHLSHTERAEQMEHAKGRLLKVITEMDRDCSGTLTKEELMNGLDTEPEFAVLMQLMDIGKSDMDTVFRMLDVDGSGDVDYDEWVNQINYMKNTKEHTLLIFIKHFVVEIRNMVKTLGSTYRDVQGQLAELTEAMKEHAELKVIVESLQIGFSRSLMEQECKLNSMSQQMPSKSAPNKVHAANTTAAGTYHLDDSSANSGAPFHIVTPAATKPARSGLPETSKARQRIPTAALERIRNEACDDLQKLQERLDQELRVLKQELQSENESNRAGALTTTSLPALPVLRNDHRFGQSSCKTRAPNATEFYICCQGPQERIFKIDENQGPSHPSAWSTAFAEYADGLDPKVNSTSSSRSNSRSRGSCRSHSRDCQLTDK